MNLRPRQQQPLDINLTPLIDVVFLLLIFFMVSTTFQRETRIEIELPEADSTEAQPAPEEKLEIVIDRSGRYFLNEREVVDTEPATLRGAIDKVTGGDTDLPVMIRADGQAPYQSVVTAMDVLAQLGLNQMSFVANRPPASEE